MESLMSGFSLKWRIIIPIALVVCIGVSLMATFISLRFSETVTDNMEKYLQAESYRYGNAIKADLDSSFSGIKALATILSRVAGSPEADRARYLGIIREICAGNKGFFGLWTVFEPDKWDGRDAEYRGKLYGDEKNGRFSPYVYEVNGQEGTEWLADYEGGEYYEEPRDSGRVMVSSPYLDTAGGKEVYVASAAVPIRQNNAVIGVAGADLNLKLVCDNLGQLKILDTGYAVLMDHTGTIVHHPDERLRTASIYEYVTDEVAAAIREVYRDKRPKTLEAKSKTTGLDTIFVISPFSISDLETSWLTMLAAPKAEVMAPVYSGLFLIGGIGVVLILVVIILLYFMVSKVTRVLNHIVEELEDASSQVNLAAGQISNSSQLLASGATEQAASLEETSAALEEMSSSTKHNADNAARTNDTMDQNLKLFNEGAGHMESMTSAMSGIDDSAGKIDRIIKTIEEIAFQTNLLALNAAVEAARAGETGAGFAIVAEEVRNLAQRSAEAAHGTTDLIKSTISNVRAGVKVTEDLSASFSKIQESSEVITMLIKEIDKSSGEQAKGVEQISLAISQLDQTTQQNAANAEESASAVSQLSLQTAHLNTMVEELVELISGREKAASSRQ
ncbi:hypothetical protein C4J81_07690 [Deltaproteobacteria bacterium Smac51]|nr:hypothetical protein C4J81_07690 [Deltaproteobacteria bacterium Smac51]